MAENLVLRVKREDPKAKLPVRGTPGSVGYDLASCEDKVIEAHGKALVATGLIVEIPEGHYGRIAPRSSLAWKSHIDVGAGVIDPDYRGKVGVVLFNHSDSPFNIACGDRIAQLILERVSTPPVEEITSSSTTERGEGGFGSTGKS